MKIRYEEECSYIFVLVRSPRIDQEKINSSEAALLKKLVCRGSHSVKP